MSEINKTESIERDSVIILSNIASLVCSVVKDVAGNDIASSLNGETVTISLLASMVTQRIRHNLIQDGYHC